MANQPPYPDSNGDDTRSNLDVKRPPATPRWVKVFGISLLVLVLLVVVVLATGVGGEHGPSRHMPSGGTEPTAMPANMMASTPSGDMVHQAQHGGQLGMSPTIHIEIVSEKPGDYRVYSYDSDGNPLSPEGVTVEVVLIDSFGNTLQVFPARLTESGDYFIATGDSTSTAQVDVRVRVTQPGETEPVEMDFTLLYQP